MDHVPTHNGSLWAQRDLITEKTSFKNRETPSKSEFDFGMIKCAYLEFF